MNWLIFIRYFCNFVCLFVCFITLSLLFPLKIITDGRDINAVDNDGCQLPTMVYMSREKKPQQPHNFKAGALNALVSFSFLTSNYIADTNFNLYIFQSHLKYFTIVFLT